MSKIYVLERFDEIAQWVPLRYFTTRELAEDISSIYLESRVVEVELEEHTIDSMLIGSGLKAYEIAIYYNGEIKYVDSSSEYAIFPLELINLLADIDEPDYGVITYDPLILSFNCKGEKEAELEAQAYREKLIKFNKWVPKAPGTESALFDENEKLDW